MSASTNEPSLELSKSSAVDHRVVVFGVPDENVQLRELLIDLADMDRVSAQLATRTLPGLLPKEWTRYQAACVATGIRAIGLSAVAVPASEIPNLSQARQVHHVEVGEGGLEILDTCSDEHSSAWDQVRTVSVGVVPSTSPEYQRPASSLAMGSSHRSWNTGANVPPRKRPEALIVLTTGAVLLLASDEMNYQYLGDLLSPISTANFARLINDLTQHSESAWITPSTRAFLDRGPVRHYEFRSREDFRDYTEFQTLLSEQLPQQR